MTMEGDGAPPAGNGNGRKKILLVLLAVVTAIIATGLFGYIRYKRTHVSTDDAYVAADVYSIAPRVSGTVMEVPVSDNMLVNKGDLLVRIEPADFDLKVEQEEASLAKENEKLEEFRASVDSVSLRQDELNFAVEALKAELELNRTKAEQAAKDEARAAELYAKGVIAKEDYEKAQTAGEAARQEVALTVANLKRAESSVKTQEALVRQAESTLGPQKQSVHQQSAKLDAARLERGYTMLYAPADGVVTRKSVQPGEQVRPGQPLMALTALGSTWIVANYKETQLTNIKPGLPVEIKVDSYPGVKLKGRVDSIMAGTGAAFSLFPPENATGNFVKIVQRVPVKIVLDQGQDDVPLRVGMSVVPTVLVGSE